MYALHSFCYLHAKYFQSPLCFFFKRLKLVKKGHYIFDRLAQKGLIVRRSEGTPKIYSRVCKSRGVCSVKGRKGQNVPAFIFSYNRALCRRLLRRFFYPKKGHIFNIKPLRVSREFIGYGSH